MTRRRLLVAPPGIVLAACVFLPAYRDCAGDPVYPGNDPAQLPLYALGLLVALMALAPSRRLARVLAIAVSAVGGWFVGVQMSVWIGAIAAVTVGAVALRIRFGELGCAVIASAVGTLGVVWFALPVIDNSTMIGGYLAVAASLATLLAATVWIRAVDGAREVERRAMVARVTDAF